MTTVVCVSPVRGEQLKAEHDMVVAYGDALEHLSVWLRQAASYPLPQLVLQIRKQHSLLVGVFLICMYYVILFRTRGCRNKGLSEGSHLLSHASPKHRGRRI
jgi:hypothetical protein